ncbi:MAG: hypothetical protein EBQ99_02645 [Planctomycetes bacterium]|nr:hypothetical protein [Planctomycetota bacterium]
MLQLIRTISFALAMLVAATSHAAAVSGGDAWPWDLRTSGLQASGRLMACSSRVLSDVQQAPIAKAALTEEACEPDHDAGAGLPTAASLNLPDAGSCVPRPGAEWPRRDRRFHAPPGRGPPA